MLINCSFWCLRYFTSNILNGAYFFSKLLYFKHFEWCYKLQLNPNILKKAYLIYQILWCILVSNFFSVFEWSILVTNLLPIFWLKLTSTCYNFTIQIFFWMTLVTNFLIIFWMMHTYYNFTCNILNGAYLLVTTFILIFWMEHTYLLQLSSQYFEWSIHTCYNFPPNILNGANLLVTTFLLIFWMEHM